MTTRDLNTISHEALEWLEWYSTGKEFSALPRPDAVVVASLRAALKSCETPSVSKDGVVQAALYVGEATGKLSDIMTKTHVEYADYTHRPLFARRKYNFGDAKADAKVAAIMLRKAWAILDPSPFDTATAPRE